MDLCEYKGFPTHPMFITQMNLEIIGFHELKHLETFTEVEVADFHRNKITQITGLDKMKNMKSL